MGIFDKIKHAIFGDAHAAQPAPASSSAPATPGAEVPAAAPQTVGSSAPSAAEPSPAAPSFNPSSGSSGGTVDVEPILDAAVKKSGQKLDWRHSVVDLMKAVGMDATLQERKELAGELHYDGDMNDSAKMNIWLHKALMKKLAENGGKVPADLAD